MFGWSNPSRVDTAFSIHWVSEAFATIVEALRKAQLQVAASGNEISDIDSFVLFDREFLSLEPALTKVIEEGFSRSSFQEALPLRGIWFTGKVNGKIALQEDLFSDKIWPEKILLIPFNNVSSRHSVCYEKFQYCSLVVILLFAFGLGIDSWRLNKYTRGAENIWTSVFSYDTREKSYCNSEGLSTWWLLNSLTKLSYQPLTPTIPASWGGGQIPEIQQQSANSIYPAIIFPAYECRLRQRAEAVNTLARKKITGSSTIEDGSEQLSTSVKALSEYQYAQHRFIRLAGPLPDETNVAKDLRDLSDYLYDSAIPASIDFSSPILLGGVMEAHYDVEWSSNELVDSSLQIDHLFYLSTAIRKKNR